MGESPDAVGDGQRSMLEADVLKDAIIKRVEFITGDSDTFLNVKCQSPRLLKGGGNFLMATGLFALVNFLAKVHRRLTEPQAFVTDQRRQDVIDAIAEIASKLPHLKKVVKGWPKPRIGDVDEKGTFARFVGVLPDQGIDLGISDAKSAAELWDAFRNALSHMAWVRGVLVGAYGETAVAGLSFEQAQRRVKAGPPSFFKDKQGTWVCNSDGLSVDVRDIAAWLARTIDGADPHAVHSTLEWVLEHEKPVIHLPGA